MKRLVLAVLLALTLAAPVSAHEATLTFTVTGTEVADVCEPPFANRGCIHFQTEPMKGGGPKRHVVQVYVYADWACAISYRCLAESGTVELDRSGQGTYYYRTGQRSDGSDYSDSFSAYVAHYGSRLTPVSAVVEGGLP